MPRLYALYLNNLTIVYIYSLHIGICKTKYPEQNDEIEEVSTKT